MKLHGKGGGGGVAIDDDGDEKRMGSAPSAPVYPASAANCDAEQEGAGAPLLGGGRTTTDTPTPTVTSTSYTPFPAPAPAPAPQPPNWDPEAAAVAEYAVQFADAEVRRGFATRVLSLVCAQLALMALMTAAFFYWRGARLFLDANPWTVPVSWVVGFAVSTTLACSERARRTHPGNLVALAAFALSFGYMVAATSAYFSAASVVVASAVTAAVSFGALVLVALSDNSGSPVDFTRFSGVLLLSSWSFLVAVAVAALAGPSSSSVAVVALSAVGAVLFSLYLLFDLQMIMSGASFSRGGGGSSSSSGFGGHHRVRRAVELDPDDYIFGALTLYLDIVNIFINILQLVQAVGDGS